jgi:TolB protein
LPAVTAGVAVALLSGVAGQQPQPPQPVPAQPSEISFTISGDSGAPPRLAVPDFIAITKDPETVAIGKQIAQVLHDDLAFEREFLLIPREAFASIPAPTSLASVPFDHWRELNADGVVVGSVQKFGGNIKVDVRLYQVKRATPLPAAGSQPSQAPPTPPSTAFAREYSGSPANARNFAHTISDELHQQQRGLRGVARTKLTFDSDRDGERVSGSIPNRGVKEIYIADYDGENPKRITVNRSLNINPAWSPDGRSIAYTSYRKGAPNILISNIFQGTPPEEVTKGPGENWLPAWSPDGGRVAFTSTRDGNPEIYVANRDGSNVRRLTFNPGIDSTPTWSPSGTSLAFTSDRSGAPQIYSVGVDGTGLQKITSESYCDRPTWSPAPYNEIAYTSRTGPGFDIKIIDLASRDIRQLTFGEGTNESPAFAPNGRHVAFSSTRAGKTHIFTIARDGKNLRQITKAGNNYQPNWSPVPK